MAAKAEPPVDIVCNPPSPIVVADATPFVAIAWLPPELIIEDLANPPEETVSRPPL